MIIRYKQPFFQRKRSEETLALAIKSIVKAAFCLAFPLLFSGISLAEGCLEIHSNQTTFSNAAGMLQMNSIRRTAADPTIRVTVKGTGFSDETVIRFNLKATAGFDDDLDAYKIMNSAPTPSVYSLSGTSKYSVNSLENAQMYPTIPVSVKITEDGNYTMTLVISDPSTTYILSDKKLGTQIPLTGQTYSFSGLKTDNPDRFELLLKTSMTTAVTQASDANALTIYSSAGGCILSGTYYSGETVYVEIIDAAGKSLQIIENVILEQGNTFIRLDHLAAGAYIVRVITADNKNTTGHITLIK